MGVSVRCAIVRTGHIADYPVMHLNGKLHRIMFCECFSYSDMLHALQSAISICIAQPYCKS